MLQSSTSNYLYLSRRLHVFRALRANLKTDDQTAEPAGKHTVWCQQQQKDNQILACGICCFVVRQPSLKAGWSLVTEDVKKEAAV